MSFTKRDTSRLRFKFPDMDYDGDGSVDANSAFYVCIFDGPNWDGFTKTKRRISCGGEDANIDDWGNLVEAYNSGSVLNFQGVEIVVDWDPNETEDGGKIFAAYRCRGQYDFTIEIPKEGTETAGPAIVLTASISGFTPGGTVFSEEDEARLSATIKMDISDITFVAATTP